MNETISLAIFSVNGLGDSVEQCVGKLVSAVGLYVGESAGQWVDEAACPESAARCIRASVG
jgi:hypothetical protein